METRGDVGAHDEGATRWGIHGGKSISWPVAGAIAYSAHNLSLIHI